MTMSAEVQELITKLSLKDGLTSGVNKALGSVGKLEGGMGRATKGAGQLGKGILKAGAVAGVVAVGGLALATHRLIDMDDAFAAVRKNVEGTEPELAALKDQLHALATRVPVSFEDLAAIASEAGALGIATKDVIRFTDTMARLSQATQGLTVEAASEAFGKFRNSLHLTEDEIERSASALVTLGKTAGSSEGDIIEVAKRFAGAGGSAKLSAAQILGLSSAISSLGVAPEAAGGSLARLFNKINLFIGTGDKKLKQFGKTAGMTADEFAKAFKQDALGTFEKFLEGLSKLSGPQQAARLSAAGIVNVRDISALQLLAGSWQEVQKQTDAATASFKANTDLAATSEKRFDTLKNKIQVLKNNFSEAAYQIATGFAPALGRAADKLTAFLQLDTTKSALQDLGKKIGASLDKVDWDKLLTAAKSAVDVLQPMLNALLGIAGVLNSLPAQVKGAGLAAILANKASGGLIGSGLGNIIGGLGSTLAKSLAASIPLFGRAFVQPVFVTNMGLGGGGLGVPGGLAGAAEGAAGAGLAGTALVVGISAASLAALGVLLVDAMTTHRTTDLNRDSHGNITPGQVFSRTHGFGRPNALVSPANNHGLDDLMTKMLRKPMLDMARGIQNKGLEAKLDKNIDKLSSLEARLAKAKESGDNRRITNLRARIEQTNSRIDSAKSTLRATTTATTGATNNARSAIVGAIVAAAASVPVVNVFVTASTVEKSITYQNRAGPGGGSRDGGGVSGKAAGRP